ncbi:MAG TPA: DnaB-like helicase C-terminal domain-containing protein, partial [Ignavibacteriaceae bacterium]|nr:DnaB-like helicase C-terminal domain-containing protein [Ignavibacteriaceae bacterium]
AKVGEYTQGLFSVADINKHIWLLKNAKYKRDLIQTVKTHLKEIELGNHSEDLEETKNGLIAELTGISIDDRAEFIDLQEYTDKIKSQMASENKIEGFSWGISDLDQWTSGIVKPRLYVLGGLKKSGKTRFIIHVIKTIHEQNEKIAFLSLEMPPYEITKLLYSSFTGFNDLRFRSSSFLSHDERYTFENTHLNQELLGIECKSALSIEEVISRIKRLAKMGFTVIAIDYLQRIKSKNENRASELEDYSIRIADSARQNNVSIILLSQLNAMAENPKEPPNMGSLKGCVEENTIIDGIPIKEYYKKHLFQEISSYHTKSKKHCKKVPSRIIDSGVKECFKIKTKSGKEIIVSGTTRLWTSDQQWINAKNLMAGDKILVDTNSEKL